MTDNKELKKKDSVLSVKAEEVITNPLSEAVKSGIESEERNKAVQKLLIGMMNPDTNNVPPVLIMKKDGELKVTPIEPTASGKINLDGWEYKYDEKGERKKLKLSEKITKEIEEVLHRDIAEVTYFALIRKPYATLKKLYNRIKSKKAKNSKPHIKLQNRIGCIYLDVEDETIQI